MQAHAVTLCLFCRLETSQRLEPEASVTQPSRLQPILHTSKHRQAALIQHGKASPSNSSAPTQGAAAQLEANLEPGWASSAAKIPGQSTGQAHGQNLGQSQGQNQRQPQKPGNLQRGHPQRSSRGPGGVLDPPAGQQGASKAAAAHYGDTPEAWSEDQISSPPPPLPVRADPTCRPSDEYTPDDATALQHQHQLQQQSIQQQHAALQQGQPGPAVGPDLAQQARERFQRSVSEQQVVGVDRGGGEGAGVLLQACLHRFVRPETLHKWTCSRSATFAAPNICTLIELAGGLTSHVSDSYSCCKLHSAQQHLLIKVTCIIMHSGPDIGSEVTTLSQAVSSTV